MISRSITNNRTLTLLGLGICAAAGLYIYLMAGEVKPWGSIDWMDVFAEGGTALFALLWLVLLLTSRPSGRVTHLLAIGLCCFIFSWWMDVLDEFIIIPSTVHWDNFLENLPIPIGLVILSIGIYQWHREELAIRRQMTKRERVFRDERLFDKLTPLGGAGYLREQVKMALAESSNGTRPLSLLAIDINDFHLINRRFGPLEGDKVLQAVTQLLLLNLRDQDLLCRLAGDRFIAILPDTSLASAKQIADELRTAVASLAYKTASAGERIWLTASTGCTLAENEDSETLIKRVNIDLTHARQSTSLA
jgi:diguanylate cyclase (GGDEF)-like protein